MQRRPVPGSSPVSAVLAGEGAADPDEGVTTSTRPLGTDRIVPKHWLRPAMTEWSPRRVVIFDSETKIVEGDFERTHTLRCWAARLDIRDPSGGTPTEHRRAFGTEIDEFADWVDGWCRADRPVWVYAHNLGFDAVIMRLPEVLIERGWEVTSSHVTDGPVWWRLRRNRERLVLTDSWSMLPAPLADIAADLGMAKTRLPDPDDDDMTAWRARCVTDVEILGDALARCMDWWDAQQLGRWSLTGTGLGWQSFRHRYLDVPILIDPDHEAAAFERRANYGGRREAYRVGSWRDGNFVDIDFVNGYPQLATQHDLPARRLKPFPFMPMEDYQRRSNKIGIIAECVVTTAVPVVPCRYGETVLYPVGTFRTTLASPEIDLVLSTGGTVDIGPGRAYQLAPTMRTWALWVRQVLAAGPPDVHPVVRRMVKHWSRAVFGRWTMRTTRAVELDAWPIPGVPISKGRWVDYDPADCEVRDGVRIRRTGASPTTRVEGWTVADGDRHVALVADVDPENTFPAVWAWIESLCRVAVWHAMQQAGPDDVWQCDTDGFILGEVHRTRVRRKTRERASGVGDNGPGAVDLAATLPGTLAGLEWAVKTRFSDLRIVGPQHLWLGGQRRLAGIATDAEEIGPNVFASVVWPSYMSQLRGAHPGTFVQPRRQQKLRQGLNPRWVTTNGRTLPVELCITEGHNSVCAPPQYDSSRNRVRLAPDQHGVLLAAVDHR